MTNKEFAILLAKDTGLTIDLINLVLLKFSNRLSLELKKGDLVTITGLGRFYVGKRAARNGRNPRTGATIAISAQNIVKLKSSTSFKRAIN